MKKENKINNIEKILPERILKELIRKEFSKHYQLELVSDEDKQLSLLKSTRNKFFSAKDKNFNYRNVYSVSDLRKNLNFRKLIDIKFDDLKEIVRVFREWRNIPTYLTFEEEKGDLSGGLASKRGNKIYEFFLNRKLEEHLRFMQNPDFHKLILRDKKGFRNKKVSNVMFLTLTCATKKYGINRVRAWLEFEHDYNIFLTRLKKEYGRNTWVMKAVESTKEGFPHIHLLVVTEKEFDVFPRKCLSGYTEYRMSGKKLLERFWPSFLDLIIPNPSKMESEGCVNFMKDYIFKDMLKAYKFKRDRDYQNDLSLALGWLFGKQCFSVSRGFKNDLISDSSIIQTQIKEIIERNPKKKLKFIGLLDFKNLSNKPPPVSFRISRKSKDYQRFKNAVYGKRKKFVENPARFGDITFWIAKSENREVKSLVRFICSSCLCDYEYEDMEKPDLCKFCFNNNLNRNFNKFNELQNGK